MEDITLSHLLVQVSRLVGIRMRDNLEAFGLPRAQGLILVQLWHRNGIAQNELARLMGITPATMTNTLQRMERSGWIERRRGKTDQRIVQVYFTPKAAQLRKEVRISMQALDEELRSALADGEHAILHRSLLKVRRHLTEAAKEPLAAGGGNGPSAGKEASR